jgi:acyl carrier protein
MSWKDRLKRSILGDDDAAPTDARRIDPPALTAVPVGDPEHDALVKELTQRLVALSEGKLRIDEIDAGSHLFDYGYVDSLTAVSFLAQLEQNYGTQIEDVELLGRLSTLHAIAAHIRNRP